MNIACGPGSRLLFVGVLCTLAPLVNAAPRVLIESDDALVSMDAELRCGRDAEVTVLARDPLLFAGDSARLQSLLDATRALLGFECRNLPGMVVTGRLDGLAETGYEAIADADGDWRLQASRTMQVSALPASTRQAAWSPPTDMPASQADFVVRDLRRGMGVSAAIHALRTGFKAKPRYDTELHLLSVVDGGCPVAGEFLRREFSLRAGDACLEAKFGDDGSERLEQLTFGQVVDRDQAASIRGVLEERYGQPAETAQPATTTTRLGWGRRLPGTSARYELEALIEVRESTTVLVLRLQGGEQAPRFKVNF